LRRRYRSVYTRHPASFHCTAPQRRKPDADGLHSPPTMQSPCRELRNQIPLLRVIRYHPNNRGHQGGHFPNLTALSTCFLRWPVFGNTARSPHGSGRESHVQSAEGLRPSVWEGDCPSRFVCRYLVLATFPGPFPPAGILFCAGLFGCIFSPIVDACCCCCIASSSSISLSSDLITPSCCLRTLGPARPRSEPALDVFHAAGNVIERFFLQVFQIRFN